MSIPITGGEAMVFCRLWVDTWLLNMRWQCYIQRSHGPTPAWQFSPNYEVVMRYPDPIVCQV